MAQIEITNRCNLTCRTCTRLKLPAARADAVSTISAGLVDALRAGRRIWLSGQGEPLLHPDLPRMIRALRAEGIKRDDRPHQRDAPRRSDGRGDCRERAGASSASRSTAGRPSRDGVPARRSVSRRVLENARAFVERKSATRAAFYTVLNRSNHASASASADPCRRRLVSGGSTWSRRFRSATSRRSGRSTTGGSTSSALFTCGDPKVGSGDDPPRGAPPRRSTCVVDLKWYRKRCFEPFQKLYVDFQGNVTPCCRIHNEVFVGNILKDGLAGSWYSRAMEQWRRDILRRGRIIVGSASSGAISGSDSTAGPRDSEHAVRPLMNDPFGLLSKNWLVWRIGRRHVASVAHLAHGRVLDVGCGEMPLPVPASQRDGARIYRTRPPAGPSTRNETIEIFGSALVLPFRSESIDAALSFQVLEHVPEPLDMLREIASRPEAGRAPDPHGAPHLERPRAPHDYFRYTQYGLEHLFRKAGFEIVEVRPMAGYFVTAAARFCYFLAHFDRWGLSDHRQAALPDRPGARRAPGPVYCDRTETWNYLAVGRVPEGPERRGCREGGR